MQLLIPKRIHKLPNRWSIWSSQTTFTIVNISTFSFSTFDAIAFVLLLKQHFKCMISLVTEYFYIVVLLLLLSYKIWVLLQTLDMY